MKENYRKFVPALALILLAGISYIDYMSDEKMEFFLFYFPLIILSVWYSKSIWPIFLVSFLSCVSWVLDFVHSGGLENPLWLFIWNSSVHCAAFIFVAFISLALREKQTSLLSLKEELHLLLEREKMLSRFDPLTGVLNLRAFEERLSFERKRSLRYNHKISFLYIDIDNFKEINDVFGHQRGDEVLKSVASSIKMATRDVDSPARLGGDEFGLLLLETDKDGALTCANKIIDTLSQLNPPIRVSIGASVISQPDNLDEEIVGKADSAMYRAKKAGGARVMTGWA